MIGVKSSCCMSWACNSSSQSGYVEALIRADVVIPRRYDVVDTHTRGGGYMTVPRRLRGADGMGGRGGSRG